MMANENESANVLSVDAPRFATLVVCFRAICLVYTTGGIVLGIMSVILSAICVIPLFNSSAGQVFQEVMPEQNHSSHIFIEAREHELTMMREEEHSVFGRMFHQGMEIWSESVEEFVYAGQVLRENQGLLILLVGGVFSMVMALVAGLDDVHVLNALIVSVTCYGVTTLLVARSTRRMVTQRILQNGEPRLSTAEVANIIDAIPEENFVPDDELEHCDFLCIENMLRCRQRIKSQKAKTGIEDSGFTLQDQGLKKKMIADLRQRRNYNNSCCICLCTFYRGERIRVLPNCHHEFHRRCIDEWAGTFAANARLSNCNIKMGRPTCPLCKLCFGEAQVCLPPNSQSSHL